MAVKVLGVDLDGVLADFNRAYVKLIHEHTGIQLPTCNRECYPDVWGYDKAGGVSRDQERALWKLISQSNTFWASLPPYPWTRDALKMLNLSRVENGGLYFITSRPGRSAQSQSIYWINDNSMLGWTPSVLVVNKPEKKMPLIEALGVTHYIDDKWETMQLLSEKLPFVKGFLFDQPWNRAQGSIEGITRVENFEDFMGAE